MYRHVGWIPLFALVVLPSLGLTHGTNLDWNQRNGVELRARFDDGLPLQSAEVTIFSPADPSSPWAEALTDSQGRCFFAPDTAGTWDVRVRKGGHGAMAHIPVDTTLSTAARGGGSTGYSTIQIVTMAACIVWGFVGTALHFRRRRG
ncbi:carboxypeptidase regulatory-like domain-containing protein [Candidatus Fermentibacteria bacterium]|nr:carboxypeptidase regulatory-like domain-containing protein [Candidatus Fermentibacteria bacterium]